MVANNVVKNPKIAINVNDQRKLHVCEINPIMGGPNRNPKNPILETAVKAIPGDMVFDFPAELNTNGTTDETPNPTNKNPKVAGKIDGINTANKSPDAISIPLTIKTFCFPNFITTQSPIKRPPAMVPINAVYPRVVYSLGTFTTF